MLPGERLVGGLTCSDVLADLSNYLDGELTPARKAAVEAHVAGCSVCAQFGARFGRMLQEVRARMVVPEPVPDDVLERLNVKLKGH